MNESRLLFIILLIHILLHQIMFSRKRTGLEACDKLWLLKNAAVTLIRFTVLE
jgi:hypothetical protein